MAKGKLKRRAAGSLYEQGKASVPTRKRRVEDDNQPGTSSAINDQTEQISVVKQKPVLRSETRKLQTKNHEFLGNRIIDLSLLSTIMNEVLPCHQNFPDHCENINLVLPSERKVGLGSDHQFACQSCCFVSPTCKTYRSCDGKGRGAAINMLLASAIQDTSIGPHKANIMLSSLDIPPPAKSHLHKLTSVAATKTISLNEEDMANKRKWVVEQNRLTGANGPRQLDVSFDCRYNANRMVSSFKPGQAASQAYGVAIENHSSYKYIVYSIQVNNSLEKSDSNKSFIDNWQTIVTEGNQLSSKDFERRHKKENQREVCTIQN
jgi:hypothetical protein